MFQKLLKQFPLEFENYFITQYEKIFRMFFSAFARQSSPCSRERMPKVCHLIVDSAPIVNGELTQNLAENFYTISEVLDEIKDERSREFL